MTAAETHPHLDALVIGAGLSGLAAAIRLHEAGLRVAVLEAADGVGGRVRTDEIDGFLLDRGFQVYLDAYPFAGRRLDLEALGLRPFRAGTHVWMNGRRHLVADAFRHPETLFRSLAAPVGGPLDKWRILRLQFELEGKSCDAIWRSPERSTESYLQDRGFSPAMIDHFFRGFYGGIFLDESLATSSRMFEFTFKMFASGRASLPQGGMEAIPQQLAARLPPGTVRLQTRVERIEGARAIAADGAFEAAQILLALDAEAAGRIELPGVPDERRTAAPDGDAGVSGWRGTTCLYFDATGLSPRLSRRPWIHLRGDRRGLVHHACLPSAAQPSYAPRGRALLSATLLGDHGEGNAGDEVERRVREELAEWFSPDARRWPLIARYAIPRALPTRFAGHPTEERRTAPAEPPAASPASASERPRIHRCGDDLASPSIEGAILAGESAAERILAEHKVRKE